MKSAQLFWNTEEKQCNGLFLYLLPPLHISLTHLFIFSGIPGPSVATTLLHSHDFGCCSALLPSMAAGRWRCSAMGTSTWSLGGTQGTRRIGWAFPVATWIQETIASQGAEKNNFLDISKHAAFWFAYSSGYSSAYLLICVIYVLLHLKSFVWSHMP